MSDFLDEMEAAVPALRRYARFFGGDVAIDYPTGSGRQHTLDEVASDLTNRLMRLFPPDAEGNVTFYEYFHGDTGAGLGASHQTGWTGLVADLLLRRGPAASDG